MGSDDASTANALSPRGGCTPKPGARLSSSGLSRKIRYNRPLFIKEARSRSAAELDRMVNEEVERVIEGHFLSKGYVFENKGIT